MDDRVMLVFYFGGRWVEDGGRRYIDGGTFENEYGYDIDYLGFWSIRNFYMKVLRMGVVRLSYRREVDGEMVELLNDADVWRMLGEQHLIFPKTHVYGTEVGEDVAPLAVLKKRLAAALKKEKVDLYVDNVNNDTWSDSDEARSVSNEDEDTSDICTRFFEDFRDNPDWKLSSISKFLQKRLGMTIGLQQCYRAKKKAQKIIEGDAKKQYNKLRDYADAINTSNPGSLVTICTQDGPPGYVKEINPVSPLEFEWIPLPPVPLFKYMYIRFAAQKYAFFSGLRSFVGLDGCFLKGTMGGQLLSTVARDGNDTMYPLAIAVVDLEDKKSWGWFLENLICDFGHPSETCMVFMSDKQKGLQEAMYRLMPGVEHRFCVKHLYENFKATYKGQEYKELLWNAASTGSKTKWKFYLDEMKKLPNGKEAVNFLMKNEPSSWSRSHFSPHCKTLLIVNNISESFNASILPGRDKPILTMLEWIMRKMMKKILTKQAAMAKYDGNLCPSIVKQMEHTLLDSANCFATACGSNLYEVDLYGTTAVVDINTKTCTCRMWELSGIPCKYTVAAIYANCQQPEAFVDSCYSRQTYMAVYSHSMKPLPSPDEWPPSDKGDVHPPNFRKPTGRPKKKRKRAADEKSEKVSLRRGGAVKCGNCKQIGHNARTCKDARIGETPYQRRERIKRAKSAQTSQQTADASQTTVQASQSNAQASQITVQASETS